MRRRRSGRRPAGAPPHPLTQLAQARRLTAVAGFSPRGQLQAVSRLLGKRVGQERLPGLELDLAAVQGARLGAGPSAPAGRPAPATPDVEPWRRAARSGCLACLGPQVVVISASSSSPTTRSPMATLMASSPSRAAMAASVMARRSSSGSPSSRVVSSRSTKRTGSFPTAVPFHRESWQTPDSYHLGRSQAGTATSLQQARGQPRTTGRIRLDQSRQHGCCVSTRGCCWCGWSAWRWRMGSRVAGPLPSPLRRRARPRRTMIRGLSQGGPGIPVAHLSGHNESVPSLPVPNPPTPGITTPSEA